jgi:hypothetical protein
MVGCHAEGLVSLKTVLKVFGVFLIWWVVMLRDWLCGVCSIVGVGAY